MTNARSIVTSMASLILAFSTFETVAARGNESNRLIQVGVAKVDVTPKKPVLLAGYGGRRGESEGIDTKIWARALVIGKDNPVMLIAVDNCGVPLQLTKSIAKRLQEKAKLASKNLVIASTHTHNAPTLPGYAPVVWGGRATAQQLKRVDEYSQWLGDKLVHVGLAALASRKAASIGWCRGRVTFGGNRRVLNQGQWRGFGYERGGPVDHSLPVLVASVQGKPFAVWVNYACHCTTVGSRNRIGGDWAGFANEAMEKAMPGVISLTTIGCGADVGPQPSGSLTVAERHGNAIAKEVVRLVAGKLRPLSAKPVAKIAQIKLPFANIPSHDHWKKQAKTSGFHGYHAKLMLQHIKRHGSLPKHLDYPITIWTFGEDLAVVFLAGEVVVDYAVRLNRELDWKRMWVTAWSNDVPCYIPSRRVLAEGGYEADFSMIYYAQPTRFDPKLEDRLVDGVRGLLGKSYQRRPGQKPFPFHSLPPPRQIVFDVVRNWAAAKSGKSAILKDLKEVAGKAQDGFAKLTKNDGSTSRWFDLTGGQSVRPFIRQEKVGTMIQWETTPCKLAAGDATATFVFLGGVGWQSQPATDGFSLSINGRAALTFDVTREAKLWRSKDRGCRLLYLPTWKSNEDSAGLFYLTVSKRLLNNGKPCEIGVKSLGRDSKRWFAINPTTQRMKLAKAAGRAINQ